MTNLSLASTSVSERDVTKYLLWDFFGCRVAYFLEFSYAKTVFR